MSTEDLTSILTDIHEILTAEPLSWDQIAEVHHGVARHGCQPRVREEIRDEVTQLARTSSTVEGNFATIQRLLNRFQRIKVTTGKVKGKRPDFGQAWKALHDEYTELMQQPPQIANFLKSTVQEFLHVIAILQNPEKPSQDGKEALSFQLESVTRFEGGADFESAFHHLREKIDRFRANFNQMVAEHSEIQNEDSDLEKESSLEENYRKIQYLETQLESASSTLTGIWEALEPRHAYAQRNYVTEDAARKDPPEFLMVTAAIAALAPNAVAGFLYGGLRSLEIPVESVLHYIERRGELTEELMERRDEEEQRISDLPAIRHIQCSLGALHKKLENNFVRFCAIHDGIRTTLLSDIQLLSFAMEDPGMMYDGKVQRMISRFQPLYDTLHFTLDQYTLQIGRSFPDPSPPSLSTPGLVQGSVGGRDWAGNVEEPRIGNEYRPTGSNRGPSRAGDHGRNTDSRW